MYHYLIPPALKGHTVHTPQGAMRLDETLSQEQREYLYHQIKYPLVRIPAHPVKDKPTAPNTEAEAPSDKTTSPKAPKADIKEPKQ